MKKILKYKFNLIEIALAICVIAIGLSGVMSLFALGAKSNRQAVAYNNLSDISEYMMNSIRSIAQAQASYTTLIPPNSILTNFPNTFNETSAKSVTVNDITNPDSNTWDISISSDSSIKLNNAFMLTHKTMKNVFLFRQLSNTSNSDETTADFSCIAYMWLDSVPHPTGTGNIDQTYATAICLELSYPADYPYEQREKKRFRFELFNQKFEINH